MSSNYIKNVAVVGATGNAGRFITESLLATGKHKVTALTRTDSKATLPSSNSENLTIKKVDYTSHASLVSAIQGIDALIITLSAFAPPETQDNIIIAATEAKIPWILPNEWGPDTANPNLVRDVPVFKHKPAILEKVANSGTSSYLAVVTGFWYSYVLGNPGQMFGFDFEKREVVFFDDGRTLTCLSTWPQIGRAVAGLLSLPISNTTNNGNSSSDKCLEDFRNKHVYMHSFRISQKDMFASILRVTETSESDWKISYQGSHERFAEGNEQIAKGDKLGGAKAFAVRLFFPEDQDGDYEATRGTVNGLLDLPEESLDEFTKEGIERSKAPPQW